MSVKKEANGRRSIQVEVEVPGTPEQVWEAIASGPGITSWFVPTRFENGPDGKPATIISTFGPGMDCAAKCTSWEPPVRFTAESEGMGPDAPPMATEWIVEARGGGKCLVRVVHSLFASTDDWDGQLEGVESGWPAFFRILRLYLLHFRSMKCSPVQIMAMTSSDNQPEAWKKLASELNLTGKDGEPWTAPKDAPTCQGVLEGSRSGSSHSDAVVRIATPAPGVATFGTFLCGGPPQVMVSCYLYGDEGAKVAPQVESEWKAWLAKKYPAPPA